MSAFDDAWLEHRRALTCLAYEILGEWAASEDIASQAWERGQRAALSGVAIENPAAWLRTVTTRLAIDEARSARARRETYVGTWLPEPVPTGLLPDENVAERSMLGLGMVRLMQELDPVERAVFILREAFAVPYAEIAECVERTPAACRQIVSRAKRHLPTAEPTQGADDRAVLVALVGAVADGDVTTVVDLVSDGCVLWSDSGGTLRVAPKPVVGFDKVLRFFLGVQRKNPMTGVRFVDVNGVTGVMVRAADGERMVVLERDSTGQVTALQMHANPGKIGLTLTTLQPDDGGAGITDPQPNDERER